jgi:hypothetical protein
MSHTILIVDDSSLIRHTLRSFIEQTNEWQVCGEAENGAVAIEKVKELHPDVVILDLQMPVMDGLEAAGQINFPGWHGCRVCFDAGLQSETPNRAGGYQRLAKSGVDSLHLPRYAALPGFVAALKLTENHYSILEAVNLFE